MIAELHSSMPGEIKVKPNNPNLFGKQVYHSSLVFFEMLFEVAYFIHYIFQIQDKI